MKKPTKYELYEMLHQATGALAFINNQVRGRKAANKEICDIVRKASDDVLRKWDFVELLADHKPMEAPRREGV